MKTDELNKDIKLIEFLEEGLDYINSWTPTEINNGGCGVFAKILSEHLTNNKIAHSIYALYFDKNDSESAEAENNLKDFIKNRRNLDKAGEDHIAVEVEDFFFDSTGIINTQVKRCFDKVVITKNDLDELVEKGKWNPEFDRTCTTFIQEKMDEIFSKYDQYVPNMFSLPSEPVHYTKYTVKQRKLQSPLGSLMGLANMFGHSENNNNNNNNNSSENDKE